MMRPFACPACRHVIEIEVQLGDHYVDVPRECDCCRYEIPHSERMEIHDQFLSKAKAEEIDALEYRHGGVS